MSSNTVNTLAEFYKHALNVAGTGREEGCGHGSLWCGWMRCYITSHLTNGHVKHNIPDGLFREIHGNEFCQFKECLLYTLQDYIDYINAINYGDKTVEQKTKTLIDELNLLTEPQIIELIEINSNLFPTKEEADTYNIFDEKYNIMLNQHVISKKDYNSMGNESDIKENDDQVVKFD